MEALINQLQRKLIIATVPPASLVRYLARRAGKEEEELEYLKVKEEDYWKTSQVNSKI